MINKAILALSHGIELDSVAFLWRHLRFADALFIVIQHVFVLGIKCSLIQIVEHLSRTTRRLNLWESGVISLFLPTPHVTVFIFSKLANLNGINLFREPSAMRVTEKKIWNIHRCCLIAISEMCSINVVVELLGSCGEGLQTDADEWCNKKTEHSRVVWPLQVNDNLSIPIHYSNKLYLWWVEDEVNGHRTYS